MLGLAQPTFRQYTGWLKKVSCCTVNSLLFLSHPVYMIYGDILLEVTEKHERKSPGVGTQTLVPLNLLAVVAPLLKKVHRQRKFELCKIARPCQQ